MIRDGSRGKEKLLLELHSVPPWYNKLRVPFEELRALLMSSMALFKSVA